LGIPVKLNAHSERKPNGIRDDPEHHQSAATLASRLCWKVFGFFGETYPERSDPDSLI
jgi:hypothetical protein